MAEQKATNVTWHDHKVSKAERSKLNGHKGAVLWFTGLSACGKSTIANTVDHLLHSKGKRSFVLDGDNIRMGLNKNLGFSAEDRAENIRRIGEVAKLFSEAGTVTLTAFISPYKADRDAVRKLLAPASSSKSSSKPRSRRVKSAIRKASTRRPVPAKSKTSPASATPTKPPKSPSWCSIPTRRELTSWPKR